MNRPARRAVRGIVGFVALAALAGRPSPASGQFDGRWLVRFQQLFSIPVEMTETGDALSFTLAGSQFDGTVTGQTFLVSTPPGGVFFPNGAAMQGTLLADPSRIVASAVSGGSTAPGFVSMRRCTCSDGNTTSGDGCGICDVEPCFACTGNPSVCTPVPDGTPCEDGRACTAGETCLGGTCGGGGPVTPCVDLNGRWHFEFESELGSGQQDRVVTQEGSYLEHSNCGGSIDPATGSYEMTCGHLDIASFGRCPLGQRFGQAAADGMTLADIFATELFLLSFGGCTEFDVLSTATRLCGDGDVQAGDQCDDGNVAPGDGCDASCHVEPCWTCAGDPSSCMPLPDGTRCGDGDACTSGDTCQDGACAPGTALTCAACEACGPLGTCVGAPRTDCRQSTRIDRTLLEIHNQDPSASGDRILWKWRDGEATAAGDLADPLAGAGYRFCLFDESAASPTLLFRAEAPAVTPCDGGDSCWKKKADGELRYRRRGGEPGGLTRLRVSPGTGGDASALVRGRGAQLTRADGLPNLPVALPIRAQLSGDGGACFEAWFDPTGARTNDSRRGFSARAASPP